jgi:hypothetical protein
LGHRVQDRDLRADRELQPSEAYKTRLKWRDLTGGEQSKLLLTEAETVIAELLDAKVELAKAPKRTARRPARGRSGSRRMEASRS